MKTIRKNEEAVSPVIGVILMVAITVILAAVIAAFVFGMGPPAQAPQSSIRASTVNITTDISSVKLEHQGGSDIALKDVKLIIEQGDSRVTWSKVTTGTEKLKAGDILRVYSGTNFTGTPHGVKITNNTQETLVGSDSAIYYSGTPYLLQTASEATITMIDVPSGQQIARATIRT